MALVMLPCDLPWWPTLQKHLVQLETCKTTQELAENMLKIHNMCNIGLDPDDDKQDQDVFQQLELFLEQELSEQERLHFLQATAPAMSRRAQALKLLKPAQGFHFSLQQQADHMEYERAFIASLLAHAFFSTFPKRTRKTHPTLQDFNFTHFYKHLDTNCQRSKLRSILHYFDQLEVNEPRGTITFSRKVMSSRDWLTIDDWLECNLPLCPLTIKHEGRIDRADATAMRICFASSRVGGHVLSDGTSQECIQFCTKPELLAVLPSVEALEDNEVLMIDGLLQVSRIHDPRFKATFEPITEPQLVAVCCMDAENYMKLPMSQFEEDNILRELNKALLGFRQQNAPTSLAQAPPTTRRLTPIGESFSSTPETDKIHVIEASPERELKDPATTASPIGEWLSPASRRGRFIVLGSSGECLPVTRAVPVAPVITPVFSSCQSDSDDEFHSACASFEDAEEPDPEASARKYSAQLDTPERRSTFAERLRDALRRETLSSSSSSSSYAVGISVAGSDLADPDIRVKRGGSRGFMLQEDSIDDQFLRESLQQEREWIDKFRAKRPGALSKAESSKYSFSTEYSSELEELYDQFSRWLEDSDSPDAAELDPRDLAVVKFAGSLLKRTLSESFAGVSLSEVPAPLSCHDGARNKVAVAARSLSLELARHKHKLAAQLSQQEPTEVKSRPPIKWFVSVSEAIIQTLEPEEFVLRLPQDKVSMLVKEGTKLAGNGLRPVATGNWGCGSSQVGDPQVKLIVQWLAASVAGVPTLHYYTCSHHKLLKLDTVCRVLLDRQWTVGELVNAAVKYSMATLNDPSPPQRNNSLFDELIGSEKSTNQEAPDRTSQ